MSVAEDPVHVHDLHATICTFSVWTTNASLPLRGRDFPPHRCHGRVVQESVS